MLSTSDAVQEQSQKKIKQTFPQARITCLDLAENMVEISKLKLNNYSDIQYQIGDFKTYEFDNTYDVVVSSLALHHLVTDEDKISFYRKIYESMSPNGIFFNADVVLGSCEHFQNLYMDKWISFMKRHVSDGEIENKWIPKYIEEDRPSKLMDQLVWLKDIGFSEIDIIWKYYNFAVYGGRKIIIA